MLYERALRAHPDDIRAGLRRRHAGPEALRTFDIWLALDAERRALATRYDALASPHALASPQGSAAAAHEPPDLAAARRTLGADVARLEAEARLLLLQLPNLPDPRVPDGADAAQNRELRRWGDLPTLPFAPRRHEDVGAALGILDLPRATRMSGTRFPLLIGAGARLARSLATLMLDLHAARGYVEVVPPHLLRAEPLIGSGHLPRHADELYAIERDELYLSPTAEAQLVALHAGETLAEADLPRAYTACAPAFRREAGSSRAATKGLIRQHQFDKVELVRIATPEQAEVAFETLLADAEAVLRALALPYRVVALCAGELPFSSQRTIDLEVWMPGQGAYVEIASISDCGAFQARGLTLRYRPSSGGAARYPHTLNGSALPIGRTLAALLENGQRADGSVALPTALAPYLPERILSV